MLWLETSLQPDFYWRTPSAIFTVRSPHCLRSFSQWCPDKQESVIIGAKNKCCQSSNWLDSKQIRPYRLTGWISNSDTRMTPFLLCSDHDCTSPGIWSPCICIGAEILHWWDCLRGEHCCKAFPAKHHSISRKIHVPVPLIHVKGWIYALLIMGCLGLHSSSGCLIRHAAHHCCKMSLHSCDLLHNSTSGCLIRHAAHHCCKMSLHSCDLLHNSTREPQGDHVRLLKQLIFQEACSPLTTTGRSLFQSMAAGIGPWRLATGSWMWSWTKTTMPSITLSLRQAGCKIRTPLLRAFGVSLPEHLLQAPVRAELTRWRGWR